MSKKKQSQYKYYIKKNSNIFEELSKKKFVNSLKKSGLDLRARKEVVEEVGEIENYYSTKELHKAADKAILKHSALNSANYNIKQAITKLGPTGYPFEVLCSQILKAKGYQTKVSCMLRGVNIKHEVDVVGTRQDQNIYCECKFHKNQYYKNDVKVALYIHSRDLDIKAANPHLKFKFALVSNTSFTKDAISYAKGVGLLLYSMNYPEKNTLCDVITRYKIYPITVLKTLRVKDQRTLMKGSIVVIKQIRRIHLENLDLDTEQIRKVLNEIKELTRK